ncbi:MAG: hypothetical protein ABIK09_21190 [Pseudomonadota bacterium]
MSHLTRNFLQILLLAILLAACGGKDGSNGGGDSTPGVDTADGLVQPDAPVSDVVEDLPVEDVPVEDVPVGDVPVGDIPVEDVPVEDVPPGDLPTGDADAADGDSGSTVDWGIVIIDPVQDAEVSGAIRVALEPVGTTEWLPDTVSLWANGQPIYWDKKLPTEVLLDTTTLNDGVVNLEARVKDGTWEASDAVDIIVVNPKFGFQRISANKLFAANGETVSIFLSTGLPGLDITADFSALDNTWAPGTEDVYQIGGGKYQVSWTVATANTVPDGLYTVPVTLSDGDFTLTYNELKLKLQNGQEIPLTLDGGIFVDEIPPPPSASWTQPISMVYGNDFIITGGSATLNVNFADYAYIGEIIGIIVWADDYAGYYQKPLADPSGDEELLLLLRAFVEPAMPPNSITLNLQVVDEIGRVSPVMQKTLSVESVGSGDIQVSVAWDHDDDVDLHVVEPTGCEIYYANDICGSGGWLDLDSNPACSIDGINNENIFWPLGQAPTGTFIVRMDYYSDCSYQGVTYTTTIHYCGNVEVYEGYFAPGTDDSGGAGSGVEVATFNNENCGRLLRGTIRYEDRTFDRWGFRGKTWSPARYAQVELYRSSDDTLLATGWTDRFGRYELSFDNNGQPGVYVKILSKTNYDNGLRPITVYNHPKFKQVYSVTSFEIDENETEYPILDFDIPAEVGAGAFNILDVLVDGSDLTRRMTGKDLGVIGAYWATGTDTTNTLFCSEVLYNGGICQELGGLNIQGKDTDRDEYDDMVILKEFFKLVLNRVSNDDGTGEKAFGARTDPNLAWTEGVSTFYASAVLGTQWFVNSLPFGVYSVSGLEALGSPFAYGTGNGNMGGKVSDWLVSATLWDLLDPAGEDAEVVSNRLAVFDAIFNYLPSDQFTDRGEVGVDLVDFLDGWFCRGWGQQSEVEGIVVEERQFPYDFGGPASCPH